MLRQDIDGIVAQAGAAIGMIGRHMGWVPYADMVDMVVGWECALEDIYLEPVVDNAVVQDMELVDTGAELVSANHAEEVEDIVDTVNTLVVDVVALGNHVLG